MKKIYNEFFRIKKDEHMSDKVFCARITFSVLTMLICCGVFCSTTLAYFTSSQSVGVANIQTAEASTKISTQNKTIGNCTYEDMVTYTCPLAEDDLHTFELEADGTVEAQYCVINIGNDTYSTQTIEKGDKVTIEIEAAEGTKITFNSNWGEYEGKQRSYGGRNVITASHTPYVKYKVREGATLTDIAKYYGVAKKDILTYNGITKLTVGDIIKIPNGDEKDPYIPGANEKKESKTPTKQPTKADKEEKETTKVPTTEPVEPTTEVAEEE